MMAEPGCCQGCVPANRLAVVEILADQPLKLGTGQLRLTGTWQVSSDPDGWRYQLRGAALKPGVTRRALMAASPLFCLPVPAMAQAADGMAVDIHSHAGNLDPDELRPRPVLARSPSRCARAACRRSASPLCPTRRPSSSPTAACGPAAIRGPASSTTSASAPSSSCTRWPASRGCRSSGRRRSSAPRGPSRPSLIVSSEGADFLEGRIERLDEAYQRWALRHLQLTHYRPNELGDIQTEPSVMAA